MHIMSVILCTDFWTSIQHGESYIIQILQNNVCISVDLLSMNVLDKSMKPFLPYIMTPNFFLAVSFCSLLFKFFRLAPKWSELIE